MSNQNSVSIKSVRVRLDHIEKITEWLIKDGYSVKYSTRGIDGEYEDYETVESVIEKKGIHPNEFAICGEIDETRIIIMFTLLHCVIISKDSQSELLEKIKKMMRMSVRPLYRIISFKIYFFTSIIIFVLYLVSALLFESVEFYLKYLVYLTFALAVGITINNTVNNIYLIRAHERFGLFHRVKDTLIMALFTAFIIAPLGPYIGKTALYLYEIVKRFI